MHLHQGERNREAPLLQGEVQPGPKSRDGDNSNSWKAYLDYSDLGMFSCFLLIHWEIFNKI